MSFHPLMVYDPEKFQRSERRVVEEGPPFELTADRRRQLDEILTRYPADRKRSAVLAALFVAGVLAEQLWRHGQPGVINNLARSVESVLLMAVALIVIPWKWPVFP